MCANNKLLNDQENCLQNLEVDLHPIPKDVPWSFHLEIVFLLIPRSKNKMKMNPDWLCKASWE